MRRVLFATTAAIGLSTTAAMAGGLAPPIIAPAAATPAMPFIPTCPPAQGAVNALIMQSYTDITVSVGADQVRVDALGPTGMPETFYYDCGNEVAGLTGIGVGFDSPGDFPGPQAGEPDDGDDGPRPGPRPGPGPGPGPGDDDGDDDGGPSPGPAPVPGDDDDNGGSSPGGDDDDDGPEPGPGDDDGGPDPDRIRDIIRDHIRGRDGGGCSDVDHSDSGPPDHCGDGGSGWGYDHSGKPSWDN